MKTRAGLLPLWIAYLAGWFFYGLVEAGAFHQSQQLPWRYALKSAFFVILPGMLLGWVVWWVTGLERSGVSRWRFALEQVIGAAAFSVLWEAGMVGEMACSLGWRLAIGAAETFIVWQLLLGLIGYALLASAFYAVRALSRLREEEARASRAEALRAEARLEALRGKLQPHFLFNALHTVTALVRTDPPKAEAALLKLGNVLRFTLEAKRGDDADDVSLADEWAFVQEYLAIEKIRLEDRLEVVAELSPEALECRIPIFTLQPLIENAIHHAIAPRARGGRLEVHAQVMGATLEICVRDDGPGADPRAVEQSPGLGLSVVRERLHARFGEKGRLAVETAPAAGFRVRMAIPIEEGGSA